MNKICFIEPPYNMFIEDLDAPFSLMYLAAIAEENGWHAQIVDMKTLDQKLPEADIYAVTSTSPQWPVTKRLSERLRAEHLTELLIVGGPHISAIPHDFQETKFDTAVIGEGEEALTKILHDEAVSPLFDCLAYHDDGPKMVYGEPVRDLDKIPFPARHLIDWSKYKRGIYEGKKLLSPAVSIISSRGCPHGCIFCGSHVTFGRKVRFRSVENVVEEIKQVISTMGYRGFNFHDDTFCINKKRVIALCEEFSKLDIYWRCLTRADTIDEDLVDCMDRGGCRELLLGIETGSQTIMDILNKGTTVKQNLKAMKIISKSKVQLKAGLIVGSPGETWGTIKETENLIKQCPPTFWNLSVFTPFPGSAVWENPEKFKVKILTKDLTQYAMVGKGYKGNVVMETEEMTKMDIEQARDELLDLLLEVAPP
jgi:anaerobic magnesium-protoporphyrin IX monomethyl ester cyclase